MFQICLSNLMLNQLMPLRMTIQSSTIQSP